MCLTLIKYSNFHPFKVVDRVSDTQLQVGEIVNLIYFGAHWVIPYSDFRRQNLMSKIDPRTVRVKIHNTACTPIT